MAKAALNTLQRCRVKDCNVLMHLSHLLVLPKVVKHTANKESSWIATPIRPQSVGTTAPMRPGHRLFCWSLPWAISTRATSTTQLFLPCKLMTFLFICSLFSLLLLLRILPYPSFISSIFWDTVIKKIGGPWMALFIDKLFFWTRTLNEFKSRIVFHFSSVSFSAFILKEKSLPTQC